MKRLLVLTCLITFFSFSQPSDLGFELNGSNDYIIIPNTTYINSNNTAVANRTIETWFKTNDATNKQVIFEEGGGTNAILIYLNTDQLYCGAYKSNGGTAEFFRSATGDILDNTWYHVAFVISTSGTTTTFLWYLNGVLQDSQTGFTVPKHTGAIELGRNGKLRYGNCSTWVASSVMSSSSEHCANTTTGNVSTMYYFDGNLWGFRVWNSGRTSTQINENIDAELSSGTNLVAYLDDDNSEYLNNSGNWTTASANGNGTTYNWSATAVSSVWNFAGNWQGSSVPSTTKLRKVVIPSSTNYPIISSEVRIGRLDLSSATSEITIQDGGTLNVYYDTANSGTVTVENNGSFILQDNEGVSGTGDFVIERDSPDYPADYYSIWATPIIQMDSQISSIFTNPVIVYKFDSSQNPSCYVQVGNTHYMDIGEGYFIRSDSQSGSFTRTFTGGSVNNGCLNYSVYYNGTTDNFNIIGNPYSSALDWASFYADNSDVIEGTMYYWNQSYVGVNNLASDYIGYNSTGSSEPGTTGNIATGLGVFVKTLQAGTVTFKNTHRVVGNNDQFFRTVVNPDDGKSWFRLSGATGYSPILIGFIPSASDGYENTHDGIFVNDGASIEFYSFIDSDRYEIQGRSELQPDQIISVHLGFKVINPGDYTIIKFLDYVDPTFDILLEDTFLSTMTNLRTGDYTFNVASPIEDNSRFILHYNYSSVLSSEEFLDDSNYINSFFSNNQLVTKVNSDSLPREIQIFDLAGKQILKSNFKEILNVPKISSGIYIIKYSLPDSSTISKKVIKR